MSVCVRVRERVCVCVCERERERERENTPASAMCKFTSRPLPVGCDGDDHYPLYSMVQMVEYKHKWSESQADLQQQLKQAKKVRKNVILVG